MSLLDPTMRQGAMEECLDEINEFVATLERYPRTTVAVAMSVHLQTVLCALVEYDLCTAEQVSVFVRELERDVCAEIGAAGRRDPQKGQLLR